MEMTQVCGTEISLLESALRFLVIALLMFVLGRVPFQEKANGKKKKEKERLLLNWSFPIRNSLFALLAPLALSISALSILEFGKMPFELILFSLSWIFQPFLEEVAVRGIILGGLLGKFGEKNRAFVFLSLLIQSAIFTLWHLRGTAVLPTFLFGIVLGLSFIFSKKNLLAPYLIHLGYNLYVLIFFCSKGA